MTIDVDHNLKWQAIWPALRALPADRALSLLDAGCGGGAWTLRIARLRPSWRIVGVDRDSASLGRAERAAREQQLGNVTFVQGDFLAAGFGTFDVVLAVAALHYAAAEGRGVAALRAMKDALAPGGILILLTPRRARDQPIWKRLPRPQAWPVFGVDELRAGATEAGLRVREMHGLFGSWCVLGKQAAMWGGRSPMRRVITLPLEVLVRLMPLDLVRATDVPTHALMLVAERPVRP